MPEDAIQLAQTARGPETETQGGRMPEITWLDRLADAVGQARTRQVPIFVDFVFPG